jgi:CRP-like cAMP-binding protein
VPNRLLSYLPAEDFLQLFLELKTVSLQPQQVIYEPNQPLAHIYFPRTGVISLLIRMKDRLVEVAMVGNEGMLGLPVLLGADWSCTVVSTTIAGEADRLPASRFRELVQSCDTMRHVLQHYAQTVFCQVAQLSACHRLHSIQERCARWLLMTNDRVGSTPFHLTQECFAQMQGVRRATINGVGRLFQEWGLIHYSRGRMTIVDRRGLQAIACECYEIINQEYNRLLAQ